MKRASKFKALLRAGGAVAAVAVLVGGVTFAALQSQQAALTGNSISTASASLKIGLTDTSFTQSQPGFRFDEVLPGGPATPAAGYGFYLRNEGTAPLALNLAVTSVPDNPNNIDLSKVNILLTTVGSSTPIQSFSLQSLLANGGRAINGTMLGGNQQYRLQVSIAADAVSAQKASLGNIDFAFSGTATTV